MYVQWVGVYLLFSHWDVQEKQSYLLCRQALLPFRNCLPLGYCRNCIKNCLLLQLSRMRKLAIHNSMLESESRLMSQASVARS